MTDLLEKTGLDVRPIAGHIGAEVRGLDIGPAPRRRHGGRHP